MAETKQEAPQVLKGIQQVIAAFAQKGIAKDSKNESQGFKFRGIDAVLNRMATHLVDANLVIVPNIRSREVNERVNSRGNPLFYVTVQVDFTICSTVDGSTIVCSVPGEAMDSGDKATNKALSIAYKYMAFQLFAIPIDDDPDRHTHELGRNKDLDPPQQQEQTLTEDDQGIVRKLLAQTDVTEDKLLTLYKALALEHIPQSKLPEITKNLQKRVKKEEPSNV